MPTIKTKDLTGAALDYAVAVAEGHKITYDTISYWVELGPHTSKIITTMTPDYAYAPSRLWAVGGPIIEREHVDCVSDRPATSDWVAYMHDDAADVVAHQDGETALIAAMRCYVAAKLGDVVSVPAQLVQQ